MYGKDSLHHTGIVKSAVESLAQNIRIFGLTEITINETIYPASIPQNFAHNISTSDVPPTYVWVIGPENPKKLWYIESGMHGVELGAGCLAQETILNVIQSDPEFLRYNAVAIACNVNALGAYLGDRNGYTSAGVRGDPVRSRIPTPLFWPHFLNQAMDLKDLNCYAFGQSLLNLGLHTLFENADIGKELLRGQNQKSNLDFYALEVPTTPILLVKDVLKSLVEKNPCIQDLFVIQIHSGDGKYGELTSYFDGDCDDLRAMLEKSIGCSPMALMPVLGDIYPKDTHFLKDIFNHQGHQRHSNFILELGTSKASGIFHRIDLLMLILARTTLRNKYNDKHPLKELLLEKLWEAFSPSDPSWTNLTREKIRNAWKRIVWLTNSRAPHCRSLTP